MKYDVVVIGAGHAGVEAALSSARMGKKTALVNFYDDKIATMPCNPSIGGPAKGIVVREIDSLGGQMAKSADKCAIQMKLLNSSRGPGVWALRAQIDKLKYSEYMKKIVKNQKNLDLIVDGFKDAIIVENKIKKIILESNKEIETNALIITTGTYSSSIILVGDTRKIEGPSGEKTTSYISEFLRKNNITTFRFKTGTPPRIKKDSIDISVASIEPGTDMELSFSFMPKKFLNINDQIPCYLIHSTEETKKIIEKNLKLSAMYSGNIKSIGPRYCPSFEDKIVRFKDKIEHQIFLEPESLSLDTLYVQGFSTSMPINIQEKMLKSLPGFNNVIVDKWAYAIEYDCIDPMQLNLNLSYKKIDNLFFAGQINGTSGYEEAAGQGLIAGINASLMIDEKKPLILKRNESYIGLMIDDLVNKGVDEPYRLLTSRAEYRLSMRNDNAEKRLKKYGFKVGLISLEEYERYEKYQFEINEAIKFLCEKRLSPKDEIMINIMKENDVQIFTGLSLKELLKQPRISPESIFDKFENFKKLTNNQRQEITIEIRFEGYINNENIVINKMLNQDAKLIPNDINYNDVENISVEARTYLEKVRPASIGQATRVRGVNPPDIQMLLFYLKNKYSKSK